MQKSSVPSFADNREIASCLREAAQHLEAQGANPFRVSAYRAAADTVDSLASDVRALFDEGGIDALDRLPHIGKGIAGAIAEILITGRWRQLERLRGGSGPTELFESVPGIGPELASRIRDTLRVETLEAEGKAWLPVLHVTREGWHFTALYSNTGRAHELGRAGEWVVLYFYNGAHEESQRTVVTETRGALVGQRVVRGRETECRAHYAAKASDVIRASARAE